MFGGRSQANTKTEEHCLQLYRVSSGRTTLLPQLQTIITVLYLQRRATIAGTKGSWRKPLRGIFHDLPHCISSQHISKVSPCISIPNVWSRSGKMIKHAPQAVPSTIWTAVGPTSSPRSNHGRLDGGRRKGPLLAAVSFAGESLLVPHRAQGMCHIAVPWSRYMVCMGVQPSLLYYVILGYGYVWKYGTPKFTGESSFSLLLVD